MTATAVAAIAKRIKEFFSSMSSPYLVPLEGEG